jgi:Fic family protein
MFGSSVVVEWRGRPLDAFVPTRLDEVPPLSTAAVRAVARAEGALGAVDGRLHAGLEVPARLLLRTEGVASSRIEEIRAPAADIAVADADTAIGEAAGWVADNLRTIDAALAHTGKLRADDLHAWHRLLMAHSDLDAGLVGAWRDRIGWVGGPTPHRAAHVPPPPALVDGLMDDLLAYVHDTTVDPVAQAAIAHAQFETIHPYADGNGRIGRILIGWVLRRRLGLVVPPPVSSAFLRDRGGYLSGLTRYRLEGPEPWVRWFAESIEQTARTMETVLASVAELAAGWPARLQGVRADSAARALLPHLVEHPALDVSRAAELAGVSQQAARVALDLLAERGVLRVVTPPGPRRAGRPRRWWVAGELLDLLTG